MANKAKIGASIVLDGEKKYKEAVTGCNNKLKELRAELGLVKEKYAENANSMEALKEKAAILDKISAEQIKDGFWFRFFPGYRLWLSEVK